MPDATQSGYFQEVVQEFAGPLAPDTVEISDEEAVKVELPEPPLLTEPAQEAELDTDSSSDEDGVASAKCGREVYSAQSTTGLQPLPAYKESHAALDGAGPSRVFQSGRMAGQKHEIFPDQPFEVGHTLLWKVLELCRPCHQALG